MEFKADAPSSFAIVFFRSFMPITLIIPGVFIGLVIPKKYYVLLIKTNIIVGG